MASFAVVIMTACPTGQAEPNAPAYLKVDGKECVIRCVEMFVNRAEIKQIIVAVRPEDAEVVKKRHGAHFSIMGVKVAAGGARWGEQLRAAAEKVPEEVTHVVVHDGARPVVPYTDIERVMAEAAEKPVVALAQPIRTGVLELDEEGAVLAEHTPGQHALLLSPQVYERGRFMEMASGKRPLHASEWTLVVGSPLNVRMGGTGDEKFLRGLMGMLPAKKVTDRNPFEEARW